MRYALLAWVGEEEPLTAVERDRRRAAHVGLEDELQAQGKLVGRARLCAADVSTTVRRRGDELIVADGPNTEINEQLAGFLVVECEHLDEAIGLAAKMPAVSHGSIEVRPVGDGPKGEDG
ncbi:MAG TPA: YciI family protein [Solirubrobacterales bacterium]|nr:YciI family protein [Solirubrobacterales bacterium]